MAEQLNLFSMSVTHYPAIKDIEVSFKQVRLVIHCMREHKARLEERRGNHARTDVFIDMELKELENTIEYLEDKLYEGKKPNKSINRHKPEANNDVGEDSFSWIYKTMNEEQPETVNS